MKSMRIAAVQKPRYGKGGASTAPETLVDIGGWTEVTPVAHSGSNLTAVTQTGSRIYYFDPVAGDNTTGEYLLWDGTQLVDQTGSSTGVGGVPYGTDPLDPTGPIKPYKNWGYVAPARTNAAPGVGGADRGGGASGRYTGTGSNAAYRSAKPDWWLGKRGTTTDLNADRTLFSLAGLGLALQGGATASGYQLLGSYGPTELERHEFIHPANTTGFFFRTYVAANDLTNGDFKNVIYLSIKINGHDRPVADARYDGLMLANQPAATGVLFEDVLITGCATNNITIQFCPGAHITWRRSISMDAFTRSGVSGESGLHVQGFFTDNSETTVLRLEEFLAFRNGQEQADGNGDPELVWPPVTYSHFNRNFYLSGTCDHSESWVKNSISLLGASGDQFRLGINVEKSFFLGGYVSMAAHGGDTQGASGSYVSNVHQIFRSTLGLGHPGGGFSIEGGARLLDVTDNIITGVAVTSGLQGMVGFAPVSVGHNLQQTQVTGNNIVHDNIFIADGASVHVTVLDAIFLPDTTTFTDNGDGTCSWTAGSTAGSSFHPCVTNNSVYSNVITGSSTLLTTYTEPVGQANYGPDSAGDLTDSTVYTPANNMRVTRAQAATDFNWPASTRTLLTYVQDILGLTPTAQTQEAAVKAMADYAKANVRKGQWPDTFTGVGINNYFREGFNLSDLEA